MLHSPLTMQVALLPASTSSFGRAEREARSACSPSCARASHKQRELKRRKTLRRGISRSSKPPEVRTANSRGRASVIAAPACAPSACRAHTRENCRPVHAVVRTVREQVLSRGRRGVSPLTHHAALSKKVSARRGAADKRRACAIAGGMVAVADYNDQGAVLAGLHARP